MAFPLTKYLARLSLALLAVVAVHWAVGDTPTADAQQRQNPPSQCAPGITYVVCPTATPSPTPLPTLAPTPTPEPPPTFTPSPRETRVGLPPPLQTVTPTPLTLREVPPFQL